jgi:hypothetical protein
MQRLEAKIGLRDSNITRDRKSGMIPAKIPTETASLEPARRSVVWNDWMVGVIGIELVTPSLFERKTYDQNVFAP